MTTRTSMKPLTLLLLILPLVAYALPDDREQPIEIVSQRAEISQQEGVAIYQGEVRMKQGSMEIDADKIELELNQGELVGAKIHGGAHPAWFQVTPRKEQEPVRGVADLIVYSAAENQIRLIGNDQQPARFCQRGNEQKGQRMTYHTDKDRMVSKARTRTVFNPKSTPGSCSHLNSPWR